MRVRMVVQFVARCFRSDGGSEEKRIQKSFFNVPIWYKFYVIFYE